jgi:hypothetical protein
MEKKRPNLTVILMGVLFIVMGAAAFITGWNSVGAFILVSMGLPGIIVSIAVSSLEKQD